MGGSSRYACCIEEFYYQEKNLNFLQFVEMARERCRDCLSNKSTFVPNDRSQCLHCVLPIMWCAFVAHVDVGLVEQQTPCGFIETV